MGGGGFRFDMKLSSGSGGHVKGGEIPMKIALNHKENETVEIEEVHRQSVL